MIIEHLAEPLALLSGHASAGVSGPPVYPDEVGDRAAVTEQAPGDTLPDLNEHLDGMSRPEASLAIGRGLPGRLWACPVEPQVAGGLSGE